MKTRYIKPTTAIMDIKVQNILQGSINNTNQTGLGGGGSTGGSGITSGNTKERTDSNNGAWNSLW